MEKKSFRFIKNILLPIKSTVEIGPDGITNRGKFVAWKDITQFNYSITSINGAMNYKIFYDTLDRKGHMINYIVTIAGSKKKKAMFAEIYQMLHEGFTENFIIPKAKESVFEIEKGGEVNLAGAVINSKGITVQKGRKKEPLFIPNEKIRLIHRNGSGGFDVGSSDNVKDRQYFQYEGPETRYLLATLERIFPEQAVVYK